MQIIWADSVYITGKIMVLLLAFSKGFCAGHPLPPERLGVVHPFALCLEHLLDDIAGAAVASFITADIERDLLDVGTGVGRAAGTAHEAHHLVVGDVVAHIEHLIVGQAIVLEKMRIDVLFHRAAHEDVLHTQISIALADGL